MAYRTLSALTFATLMMLLASMPVSVLHVHAATDDQEHGPPPAAQPRGQGHGQGEKDDRNRGNDGTRPAAANPAMPALRDFFRQFMPVASTSPARPDPAPEPDPVPAPEPLPKPAATSSTSTPPRVASTTSTSTSGAYTAPPPPTGGPSKLKHIGDILFPTASSVYRSSHLSTDVTRGLLGAAGLLAALGAALYLSGRRAARTRTEPGLIPRPRTPVYW